jgi:NADH:ubiquinone oxidoreductase subunit F (NADH-binding)/NADH:ubiquinone oxidoreductase subunit E/Pyruvate/2-oxoacid:ferredoxin oxidoreductase delta subunit
VQTIDGTIVERLIDASRDQAGSLMTLLEAFQSEFGHLPRPALERASERLNVPLSHIYGVATFYNAFSLTARGEHTVKVCLGTACHVAGGGRCLEEAERQLGIKPGQTTPDGRFTLEVVHCLGACAIGPIVVVDEDLHESMQPAEVRAVIAATPLGPSDKPTSLSEYPTSGAAAPHIRSVGDLAAWRANLIAARSTAVVTMAVCGGPGCRPRHAVEVQHALEAELARVGLGTVSVVRLTGCHGFCDAGPLLVVQPGDVCYQRVKVRDVPEIVAGIADGTVVERLCFEDPETGRRIAQEKAIPFYARQKRLLLPGNQSVDPTSIEDAVGAGAYHGLARALAMSPLQVIDEVRASGLRGRGGAGFPTANKWEFCRRAPGDSKVVICNADEGDPGAFMDRSILEGDPHSIIEGMAIGAYAIGADRGIVYVRDEYPLAVRHLGQAIGAARRHGLLGRNLLGSGFSFDVELVRGAGAFVCGEETALIASVEGERGMPRAKPPFPATRGLHGLPTNINNVKTWKYVQVMLRDGHQAFSEVGAEGARGTMLFSLVGKVRHAGLVEVPLGTTLRELVYDVGGGPADRPIKAVQIGGPSGGCVPEALFDTPLTYEALAKVGAILGSGGVIVLDETSCMVDVARYFVKFTRSESCGKCVPCQMGTQQLGEILDRIVSGRGRLEDLDQLQRVCEVMREASLCGLGKTAPNPVLTTLRYFRDEYLAHIERGCCPAAVCRDLVEYWIDPTACVGCSLCRKVCPAEAITGQHKGQHVVDSSACVRCGSCFEVCPGKVTAVHRLSGIDREEVGVR